MPTPSPFVSLSNTARMQALPLVLLGPMLRRVEKTSVSVFVACRESFDARLVVAQAFDSSNQALNIKVAANQLQPKLAGAPSAHSVRLGAHLHVALVTLPLAAALFPGRIYQYSLQFVFGIGTRWLDETNVLSTGSAGVASIKYGNMPGPTFVLPAATPGGLRFAHASCRKPHGGKIDALAALDDVLAADHGDLAKRPQQLFLTGDQVYTDDVSPTLLFLLRDASKALLQLTHAENAPIIGWEYDALTADDRRAPGNRQKTVFEAELTSDAAANHLFYLGEFYAMYLFAWSEMLWPAPAHFPSFADVWPGEEETTPIFAWGGGLVVDTGVRKDTKACRQHKVDVASLIHFRSTLHKIRRALANIPSYMIVDDHEVSDDWFLHRQWCSDVLASPLGRRIVQNAIAAFDIFQIWGNVPASFADVTSPPKGRRLLDRLAKLASPLAAPHDWPDVGTALLPTVNPGTGTLEPAADAPDLFFNIDFGTYRLIALDTRTQRGFDGPKSPPRLIAASHLAQQLPNLPVGNFALVLSATPIVGFELAEALFTSMRTGSLVSSAIFGPAYLDFEAWSFNQAGFQDVMWALSRYERVLILSGDVHYSFTNFTHYWEDRTTTSKYAVFAQLCSSSTKNTESKPEKLESAATAFINDTNIINAYFAGYITPNGKTIVERLINAQSIRPGTQQPKWQYHIQYGIDMRPRSGSGGRGFAPSVAGLSGAKAEAQDKRQRLETRQRFAVAADNIGLVSFDWTAAGAKVYHDIYWSVVQGNPQNAPAAQAHTRQMVQFDKPDNFSKPIQ